jgi:hypothetical protein
MKMHHEELSVDSIQLDLDNPRIKQYIEMYGENITSEGIALALSSSSGSGNNSTYTALKESIRVSGGIINPIIVNRSGEKLTVIEGNTRVQIYKEFAKADPEGPWRTIIAVVYDDLPVNQIHAIRLQTHLVGPRDWDPFSKAKYLHQLSNIDKLPMATIISYCGGKGPEIRKLIDTYVDMTTIYFAKANDAGIDPNPQEFSKFAELQNRSIQESLVAHHFTKDNFAQWVVNGNIDSAQNVRKLPAILASTEARNVFLRSNISEAEKYVNIPKKGTKDLSSATIYELANELTNRIGVITYQEVKALKYDPQYEDNKNCLRSLLEQLQGLVSDISYEE